MDLEHLPKLPLDEIPEDLFRLALEEEFAFDEDLKDAGGSEVIRGKVERVIKRYRHGRISLYSQASQVAFWLYGGENKIRKIFSDRLCGALIRENKLKQARIKRMIAHRREVEGLTDDQIAQELHELYEEGRKGASLEAGELPINPSAEAFLAKLKQRWVNDGKAFPDPEEAVRAYMRERLQFSSRAAGVDLQPDDVAEKIAESARRRAVEAEPIEETGGFGPERKG